MSGRKFLLISSPFRSGSALFSRILNAHSQVSLMNDDLKFFRFCYDRYLPLSEDSVRRMLSDVAVRMKKRFEIDVDVDGCLKNIIRKQPVDHAAVYSALFEHLLGDRGTPYIGEMESIAWREIPLFLEMFPESKALLIIRDIRDVVVAFKKKTIAPGNDYLIALFNVLDAMDYFLRYQKEYPDRFFGMRFEALKENTEQEIRTVCAFLGLDYEPGMIEEENWTNFHGETWRNKKVSSFYKEGDADNPVGRWRRLIEPEDLYLCEWIAALQMQAFGMKPEGPEPAQEVIDRAVARITSSPLLDEAFTHWRKTGEGVERYPLDPANPQTWDKGPK